MIVSIMQPAYLPWLGYFHRIDISDVHIVLDNVQIDRNSKTKFTNRNRVRTPDGWCWLTVPIKSSGKTKNLEIDKLEIVDDKKWMKKHWSSILRNYSKAEYFKDHKQFFEDLYGSRKSLLIEVINEATEYLLKNLNIGTKIKFSSDMNIEGRKSDLILNLCKAVGASVYMSGIFGKDYLEEDKFSRDGIHVVYHDYHHPIYPQVYPNFQTYMSVIDLLFNCGPESLRVIRKDQEEIPQLSEV